MHLRPPLDPATLGDEPFAVFAAWFEDARARGQDEAEACALATVGEDGAPSLRMVLLRGFDARGFVFFTNYESRKGRDLEARPQTALTFYWPRADRQVRIEGLAARVSADESDAYFASRPYASRLSAMASPQSRPIADRDELLERVAAARAAQPGPDVPRPAYWGGYRLVPRRIEFWQAGADRLHDRVRFDAGSAGWSRVRLAP